MRLGLDAVGVTAPAAASGTTSGSASFVVVVAWFEIFAMSQCLSPLFRVCWELLPLMNALLSIPLGSLVSVDNIIEARDC